MAGLTFAPDDLPVELTGGGDFKDTAIGWDTVDRVTGETADGRVAEVNK